MKDKFKREVFEITTKEYISVCQYDYVDDMFKCPNCKTFKKICIYATDNNNNSIIKSKYCCNYNSDDFPQKTTNVNLVDLEKNEKKKIKEKIKTYLYTIERSEDKRKKIQKDYEDFFSEKHTTKELNDYNNLTKTYVYHMEFAERLYNEIFEYVKPKLIKHVNKIFNDFNKQQIMIDKVTILKDSIKYSYIINTNQEMINSPVTEKITYDEIFS